MACAVTMFGCAKKETTEEGLEPMSMEALSTINMTQPVAAEVKATEFKVPGVVKVTSPATQVTQVPPPVAAGLEPLPPVGTGKPASTDIQTALKNAGFYTGVVDGKIGPMSKKAIEEFQKANGLQADGKVGPKTWAALVKYLNPVPVAPAATTTKTR